MQWFLLVSAAVFLLIQIMQILFKSLFNSMISLTVALFTLSTKICHNTSIQTYTKVSKNKLFRNTCIVLIAFFGLIPTHGCTGNGNKEEPAVFKQVAEIKEIKPQKPVKIKLKRNAKGEYSWDINGNNTDEIIKADKKLREGLGK